MSFSNLGLSEPLVRAVTDAGYTQPTPIQAQAIPAILAGGDLLAGAQTGTGKTAGFTLPLLHRLSQNTPTKVKGRLLPRALILAPTRELAAQVEESVRTYGKHLKLTSAAIYGGVGIGPQITKLRKGVDILVATPGRLLDHHTQRTVDLSQVEILVLDEADRMLDMGFIHDIKRILSLLPKQRQNLLFSATFSSEIKALADGLLNAPALIEAQRRNTTVEMIAQRVHPVDRDRKRELLSHLIKANNWHQVLVFARTKHGADRLAEQLEKDGITSDAIHGNKSQNARMRALADFKRNKLQVLVATDIAARGIDIDQLPHVVNYELPNVPEDYVHRIGRTGRAGASGEAISLVCVDERGLLAGIERFVKRQIDKQVIAGFEPDPRIRPEPLQKARGGQRPGQGAGNSRSGPNKSAAAHGQAAARNDSRHGARNGDRYSQDKAPGRSGSDARPARPAQRASNSRSGGRPGFRAG